MVRAQSIVPYKFLISDLDDTKMCLLDGQYKSIEARFVMSIARIV
jgi:hypothetical protein